MRYYGIQTITREGDIIRNMNAENLKDLIKRLEQDKNILDYEIPEKYSQENKATNGGIVDKNSFFDPSC